MCSRQFLTKRDDASARVENNGVLTGAYFNAGGVAAESNCIFAGRRITTAHAPEPNFEIIHSCLHISSTSALSARTGKFTRKVFPAAMGNVSQVTLEYLCY